MVEARTWIVNNGLTCRCTNAALQQSANVSEYVPTLARHKEAYCVEIARHTL
jgi:hypothetical protein